ncbi:MAG: hypothetical protein EHM88_05705 [Candidatus Rokuibacteriota bacterium]|nr:MAG: hypothetical protein EHM88_05705 [Candidatus Rokubacteria bacterium]
MAARQRHRRRPRPPTRWPRRRRQPRRSRLRPCPRPPRPHPSSRRPSYRSPVGPRTSRRTGVIPSYR